MGVINYVSGDRYVLLIVNQNASAIWGTQDSLEKGYRITGEKEKKTSALEDVFVFPSIDKCLNMIQEYVDLQAEMRADQVAEGGDYQGRYVAVSAGPINDLSEAELKTGSHLGRHLYFALKNKQYVDSHVLDGKITYPEKEVTAHLKDYVMKRSEAGVASKGHITLWKPLNMEFKDDRRQDIRLYEWLIIPVGGEE
jgi:hypothetical protein